MKTTRLEEVKIEDASESLKSLMKQLVWLEKNGWGVVQISHGDIIGQGCGNYPSSLSVDAHIHMMKKVPFEQTHFYLFEDKTTMKVLK